MGFFDFLKFSGGKSVIGVDVGMSSIKVVQIKKKRGRAVLETYGAIATGPYAGIEVGRAVALSAEKIVEVAKDVFREANVTSKIGGFSIPLSSSFIAPIKIPAVEEKRLAEVISLEARRYVPLPINEVFLDWFIVPKEEKYEEDEVSSPQNKNTSNTKNFLEALVFAIHNEALQKYNFVSTSLGINSPFFEIEIFSTMRSALLSGAGSQMIMDIGAGTTKLFIIDRGILKSSHTINKGSQDITLAISKALGVPVDQAENLKRLHGMKGGESKKDLSEIISLALDFIFYESNRLLINYEKTYNKPISRVILSGGGALLKGLNELAQKNFQTEVALADPFNKLQSPAFLSDILKEAGPEFTVAVGLALRQLAEMG